MVETLPVAEQSDSLEPALDGILSESEREFIMTASEYREWRLANAREHLGTLNIDLENLSPSEILYQSAELATAELWNRPREQLLSDSIEGLSLFTERTFRPVLVIPEKDVDNTPVERTQGRIPLPERSGAAVRLSESLLCSPNLQDAIRRIQDDQLAVGVAVQRNFDPAFECLGGVLTIAEVQQLMTHRVAHLVEWHHMCPVHAGSETNSGDEIQLPVSLRLHFRFHMEYMWRAWTVVQRLEQKSSGQTLTDAESRLLHFAEIEFAQNAQSADVIRNTQLAFEWSDQAIRTARDRLVASCLASSSDPLIRKASSGVRLSPKEQENLQAMAIPVSIRDIVYNCIEPSDAVAAFLLTNHLPERLIPTGSYSQRTPFHSLPVGEQEPALAEVDWEGTEAERAEDFLAQRCATLYFQALYGNDTVHAVEHETSVPDSVRIAREEALENFMEQELPLLLHGIDLGSSDIDELTIRLANMFNFGVYGVIGEWNEETYVARFGGELDQLAALIPNRDVLSLAGRCYENGYSMCVFSREAFVNLEGDSDREKYEVPGVERAASLIQDVIERGQDVSIVTDNMDADGASSAVIMATAVQALTDAAPMVFTGADRAGHGLSLRSLVDVAESDTGLIIITDKGSEPEAIRKFFDGIDHPVDILRYVQEHSELTDRQRVAVLIFVDGLCSRYGWAFEQNPRLTADLKELATELESMGGCPKNIRDFLEGADAYARIQELEELLDNRQIGENVRRRVTEFIEKAKLEYDWNLKSSKEKTAWKDDALRFARSNAQIPNLERYIRGDRDSKVQFLIIDHHEVSRETLDFYTQYGERILVVNPKLVGIDGQRAFSYDYSAGMVTWQVVNSLARKYPEYTLSREDKQQVFEDINRTVIARASEILATRMVKGSPVGEIDISSVDLHVYPEEELARIYQQKSGLSLGTARKHVHAALTQSLESSGLGKSQLRFYRSYTSEAQYAFDFRRHTAIWAAMSTSADVMPVGLAENSGGNVWVRSAYQYALSVSSEEELKSGGRSSDLASVPGYERLKTVVATVKGHRTSSLNWFGTRPISYGMVPLINAFLRSNVSSDDLKNFYKFLLHRAGSNRDVKAGRKLLENRRRKSYEESEIDRAAAIISMEGEMKDLSAGVFMVADITREGVGASSRTGVAAQHLVTKSDRTRPAIVISEAGSNYTIKASVRVPGGNHNVVDVINELKQRGLIISGGGHALAAGFTAKRRDLKEIVELFNQRFDGYVATDNSRIVIPLTSNNAGLFGSGSSKAELIQNSFRHTNLWNVSCDAATNIAGSLEPFGNGAPGLSFQMPVRLLSVSSMRRLKDDPSVEYVNVLLEDENGNRNMIVVSDKDIIKTLAALSRRSLDNPLLQIRFSWIQTESTLPLGVQEIRRNRPDGKGQIRRRHFKDEENRANVVLESLVVMNDADL